MISFLGKWVAKKNNLPFYSYSLGKGRDRKEGVIAPCIKISKIYKKCKSPRWKEFWRVSCQGGRKSVVINWSELEIVSEEEAKKRNSIYNSFQIIDGDPIGHYRSEDGQPKIGKRKENIRESWWVMTAKYPEKKFVAYQCGECGLYHVGKDKENVSLNNES